MGSGVSRHPQSAYRFGCPLETETNDTPPPSWIGTSLILPPKPVRLDAHFTFHGLVGTGMLGRVRLVQHKKTRKFYALKTLAKADVLKHSMLVHVERERDAFLHLTKLHVPFLAPCFGTIQTPQHIHLVLAYAPGGELRRRLHDVGGSMTPDEAKFYAAELVVFISTCHRHGYMYRDLKPENILLTASGHIEVVDLGFVRRFQDPSERCTTSVGTPAYLAPEQLTPSSDRRQYTCSIDWWALACVVFELVAGQPPFSKSSSEPPFEVYTRILQGRIQWPRRMPPPLKNLLRRMLSPDVTTRLCENEAIRSHEWFKDVDWNEVEHGDVAPPFHPMLKVEGDRACFDEYVDDDCDAIINSKSAITFATEFRNF